MENTLIEIGRILTMYLTLPIIAATLLLLLGLRNQDRAKQQGRTYHREVRQKERDQHWEIRRVKVVVEAMNYKSKRWRRKRENVLKRDGYKCKECIRYGRVTEANTVHHIKPVEDHAELAFDNKNLISLCHACHNKMHDRYTDELTQTGQRLKDRVYRGINQNI